MHPSAPRPFALRHKPTQRGQTPAADPSAEVDRRQPYMSLPDGVDYSNLNGVLPNPEGAGDSAAEGTLSCRHFAALYCLRSLGDSRFHPSALAQASQFEAAELQLAEAIDQDTSNYADHIHLLPSRRFAEFVTAQFQEMLAQDEAPPLTRVYCATTYEHAMGLRLKLKPGADGEPQFVVNVYDPNFTDRQVSCRTSRLADFSEQTEAYDFLVFLTHPAMGPQDTQEAHEYFPAADLDHHLQIFQLRPTATLGEPPVAPSTNWCTQARVELLYANRADMNDEMQRVLANCIPNDGRDVDPATLDDWPGTDDCLLLYAMEQPDPRHLRAWRQVWQRQPPDWQVHLLMGRTKHGAHVIGQGQALSADSLNQWFEMAASLPLDDLARLLLDRDGQGMLPLNNALSVGDMRIVDGLGALVQRVQQASPAAAMPILSETDPPSRTPLVAALLNAKADVVTAWAKLAMGQPTAEAWTLLANPSKDQNPLWAHLMRLDQQAQLRWLAHLYDECIPEEQAPEFEHHLALVEGSKLVTTMPAFARRHPEVFRPCLALIAHHLDDDTRAWLMKLAGH